MSFEVLIPGDYSVGDVIDMPVAANAVIADRDMVCTNASGYAVPGADAANLICWGSAEDSVDNTDGANGAVTVRVRLSVQGAVFCYSHSGLTQADVGKSVTISGPKSVGLASATTNDISAGILVGLTSGGTHAVVKHPV